MALQDMQAELRGAIPKLAFPYAKTLINRAWRTVRERNLWSFQLCEGQWIAPARFTGAQATTVQGFNTVTITAQDATDLNTALGTSPFSFITQRQFRIGSSGIYNIWGYDGVGTLTLDRPWGEPSATTVPFTIYQCYFAPQDVAGPITDFKTWISVRDMQNFIDLFTDKTRSQIDEMDPQRTWFYFPTDVVPYQTDQNPQSPTYRTFLWELWGAPTYSLNYQLYFIRRGQDLSSPNDALPVAVGEDCVLAKAREYAYEWAEANRDLATRSVGPDFKFLMKQASKEFEDLLRMYRREDRETCDNWFFVRRHSLYGKFFAYYNSQGGTSYPGVAFGS